jgi:hypothetical protein
MCRPSFRFSVFFTGAAERFKKWGQDSGGLWGFVSQKLTHFCEKNMIFWQLLAEEIAVCSDDYTNNHRHSQELCLGGPVERRRREFESPKVFPSPLGRGLGRGYTTPQKSFEFFYMEIVPFGGFWGSKVESCIG